MVAMAVTKISVISLLDNGCFQRILYGSESVSKALDIRKNGERPLQFMIKKREGLPTKFV